MESLSLSFMIALAVVVNMTWVFTESAEAPNGFTPGAVKKLKRMIAESIWCFAADDPGRDLRRTSFRHPKPLVSGGSFTLVIFGAKKRDANMSPARGGMVANAWRNRSGFDTVEEHGVLSGLAVPGQGLPSRAGSISTSEGIRWRSWPESPG